MLNLGFPGNSVLYGVVVKRVMHLAHSMQEMPGESGMDKDRLGLAVKDSQMLSLSGFTTSPDTLITVRTHEVVAVHLSTPS